ncbi:MAG: LysE family translocator [Sulfuricella sp.]|nr:LysE family translocator [Sulfuricella sp.]
MPDLPLFLAASVLLTLAPGPDNIYVLTRGVTQGRKAALVATLGFASGLVGHTLLAVFGIAAVIRASALLFDLIKYAGAAYLIYLGYKTLRHGDALRPERAAEALGLRRIYWQSVLANLLNPKVTLFFLSFLPQFVDPHAGRIEVQMALLGVVFMGQTLLVFGGIALAAGTLGNGLMRRPAWGRTLNRLAGATFIGLGLRLAVVEKG